MLEISSVLERFPMEHKGMKNSLDSRLQIDFICSVRIRSRNRVIPKKRPFIKLTVGMFGSDIPSSNLDILNERVLTE